MSTRLSTLLTLQVSQHKDFESLAIRFEGENYFLTNLSLFWRFVLALAVVGTTLVGMVGKYAVIKRILVIGFRERWVCLLELSW